MPNKDLQEFVANNRDAIERWLKVRPSIKEEGRSTYDDLTRAIEGGNLKVKYVPKNKWQSHLRKGGMRSAGGYFLRGTSGDPDYIYTTKEKSSRVMPHEAMHFYASHWPGKRGTPKKINPYIKADMALRGWLPSFHPAGRRPHIGGMLGETELGNWWNKNKATKDAEYSNRGSHGGKYGPYHPWFDEQAFDLAKTFGKKSNVKIDIKNKLSSIKNKFESLFNKEKSFGETFKKSRGEGLDEFEWKGKKYHTKYKEEMKPKEGSFLEKLDKISKDQSWRLRGGGF